MELRESTSTSNIFASEWWPGAVTEGEAGHATRFATQARSRARQPTVRATRGKQANKRSHKHDDHDDDHHEGLEPKLTIEELTKHRTFLFAGPRWARVPVRAARVLDQRQGGGASRRESLPECRDSPHFDTEGYGTNRELGRRIQKAFTEAQGGQGFVMAWRIYPDKDHPRWQIADGCSCGCGCHNVEEPPTPKPAQASNWQEGQEAERTVTPTASAIEAPRRVCASP